MKRKLVLFFSCFISYIFFAGCETKVFAENYSLFRKKGLYGIISSDRSVVLPPRYDYVSINSNSVICSKDKQKEIYDSSMKLLYSSEDTWVNLKFYTENEILIRESKGEKTQLLNVLTGKLSDYKKNKKYNSEEGYRDNVGLVWEKDKGEFLYSIANRKGKILLTDIEQAHSVFSNGMLAVIMKDGKSGFVNKKGKLAIETSFFIEPDDIAPRKYPMVRYFFNENYALVKNNEKKWIQYNINGDIKLLPDDIEPADYCYENGLVPVLNIKSNKYGYMNPNFEVIIPC